MRVHHFTFRTSLGSQKKRCTAGPHRHTELYLNAVIDINSRCIHNEYAIAT